MRPLLKSRIGGIGTPAMRIIRPKACEAFVPRHAKKCPREDANRLELKKIASKMDANNQ